MSTPLTQTLLLGASLGLSACAAETAAPTPAPCPAPWATPSATALSRVTTDLAPLDPHNVDACVAGFMGGTLVARFASAPTQATVFLGAPMPDEQAGALVEGLRTSFPDRIGTTTWSPVASGTHTIGDNVEQRVLFKGPERTYLYVFDWAG